MNKWNVYEEVTKRIIEQMEKGVIPWRKPWSNRGTANACFPCYSFSTGKPYDIMNQMLLGFEEGTYITFNQCKQLGGNVKKGEKGHFVVGWVVTQSQRQDADGNGVVNEDGDPIMEKHFGLRYYTVFKVETQCENINLKQRDKIQEPEEILEPSEVAEEIIRKYIESADAPTFNNNGSNEAYYRPATDTVVVPNIAQYKDVSEYYSTAFHELTHSTMKASRCNREEERKGKKVGFGSEEYSKEELVAEIGAAALVNFAGIETNGTFQNSASYIQGWSKKLKEQPKMIVYASAQAQKAIDYILSR